MIKDNKPYEYRLTYIDGDREITHIFSAFITGNEMHNNLRQFLLAASWSPESIDSIIGVSEDE